jgi:5-methylcytosine-specific restriction endonuclease McrA
MSQAWSSGSTRAWRTRRALVLARDRYLCQMKTDAICTVRAPLAGGHVHHKHGRDSGCVGCAADHPDHLIAACKACNLHAGNPSRTDPICQPVTRWT